MQLYEDMTIIGVMSGTSLDGVDLACCRFSGGERLQWSLLAAETIPYPDEWRVRLSTLEKASAYEYALADVQWGHYIGCLVRGFLKKHELQVDYVASHGHTIFHQPHLGLTTQIGDGDAIAAECGLPVVFNFRRMDVALGGQGAPLVPIGDQTLFADYDACLNLGGIANISYRQSGACPHRAIEQVGACPHMAIEEVSSSFRSQVTGHRSHERIAFDISPCNMALNLLARKLGQPYDKDGNVASSGKVAEPLLSRMNALGYYSQPAPKSLGKEWFVSQFQPLIEGGEHSVQDLLRTSVEHIAVQIAAVLNANNIRSLLVTGGGAKNGFLISRLRRLSPDCEVTVPSDDIIDYKEAIIFALLGYLRLQSRPNCLSSVTGASRDNIGGDIAGL